MFDKIAKQIDAVFVAAPDHHHAPAAMMAMKLGKHVYVEKPLAHSIDEVRTADGGGAGSTRSSRRWATRATAARASAGCASTSGRGAIGNVIETYSWAPTGRGGTGGRLPTKPVPAGLHWDEWIGPCPFRDYHDELHPLQWRSWWEFGDGSVGDWGCHNLDGAVHGPEARAARPASRSSSRSAAPTSGSRWCNAIRWNFPARGDMPPVKVHLVRRLLGALELEHQGRGRRRGRRPRTARRSSLELEKKYGRDLKNGGTIYVGDKGIMLSGNYVRQPADHARGEAQGIPRAREEAAAACKGTHQADFLRACKDGEPACSNFDYAGPSTEMVLLGCLAERAGVGQEGRVGRGQDGVHEPARARHRWSSASIARAGDCRSAGVANRRWGRVAASERCA